MESAPTTPVKEVTKKTPVKKRPSSETKKTHPKYNEMVMSSIVELVKESKNRTKGMTTVLIANFIKKTFDLDPSKCHKNTKTAIDRLVADGELIVVDDKEGVPMNRFKLSDSAKKRIKKDGTLLKSKSPPKKKASKDSEKGVTKKTPAKKTKKATTPKKPAVKKSAPKKTTAKTPKKTPTKKTTAPTKTTPKRATKAAKA